MDIIRINKLDIYAANIKHFNNGVHSAHKSHKSKSLIMKR